MTVLGRIRARGLLSELESRKVAYARQYSCVERLDWQLAAWNREWRRIRTNVPYFRQLVAAKRIPDKFESWEEFRATVPAMTRATVQQERTNLQSTERPHEFERITGGSTAQPLQMPAWNSEHAFCRPDMWMARDWFGVTPADRLFMLWGHSHLLGTGLRGWRNARKRQMLDWLLAYRRCSAYDLQPQKLQLYADTMLRFRPDYLIAYSVALDLFVRKNRDYADRFRNLNLKVAIAAAEGFPAEDSEAFAQEVLGCPVAMEYGSVETNLVAHSHPSGGYGVFWQTYFVETEERPSPSGGYPIRVTSLYPRSCPLVRYEIGDEVELSHSSSPNFGLDRFQRVMGRCNDYILLNDGTCVHSEAFTHAIRYSPEVALYQVVQESGDIRIRLVPKASISASEESEIRMRLGRIHPELSGLPIDLVPELERTRAGKVRAIIRR